MRLDAGSTRCAAAAAVTASPLYLGAIALVTAASSPRAFRWTRTPAARGDWTLLLAATAGARSPPASSRSRWSTGWRRCCDARSRCRAWTSRSGIPADVAHAGRGADDADRRGATSTSWSRRSKCASSPTATRTCTSRCSPTFSDADRGDAARGRGAGARSRATRIEALNRKYRSARRASSCSIGRAAGTRASACWMGYERKRGKLAELNALLRGGAHGSLRARRRRDGGAAERAVRDHARHRHAAAARRGAPARRRDGASAEPAALRRESRRVTEGYGILQPRVARACRAERLALRAAVRRRAGHRSRTRARSPTSTRICSAKARSSARASTTSMRSSARSRAASRRTASSATTCSKAATRARAC